MIIKTLLKKGADHLVNCEDDLHFCVNSTIDGSEYQIGAIFDGCSTGYKSHFASTLFGKIFKEVLNKTTFDLFDKEYSLAEIAKATFVKFFFKLKDVAELLDLNYLEIESTFIIVFIKDNKAYFIVSGDGCIMVDDQEIKIESDNNEPDYLAYHLNCTDVFDVYDKQIKKYQFDNFNDSISICSDGIYSFKQKYTTDCTYDIIQNLLVDKNLIKCDVMLARKYNILIKQGYSNYDDLSIIRFIKQ